MTTFLFESQKHQQNKTDNKNKPYPSDSKKQAHSEPFSIPYTMQERSGAPAATPAHPAVVQRKIEIDASDNANPPLIKTNGDRSFRNSTKSLYRGASIAHVIPFAVMQNFMKDILHSAVDINENKGSARPADQFYIDPQKKKDMRRLVKSVIPSAGYQFDFHEAAELAAKIQNQQDSAMANVESLFPPSVAAPNMDKATAEGESNQLLNTLNNSFANLRTGYKDTNELIQDHLDPITAPAGGSTLSKVQGLAANAPASSSFQSVLTANGPEAQIGIDGSSSGINELSLAKRMHKLGRLREKYPSVNVYGIMHAYDNANPQTSSFYSSEEDIGVTPGQFKTTHTADPALTRTAHIKSGSLQKSEYEFAGHAASHAHAAPASTQPHNVRSALNSRKSKSLIMGGILGIAATGTAALLSAPILGAAGIGLLAGSAAFGGTHYLLNRDPKVSAEKAAIEATKFHAAKQDMQRLSSVPAKCSADYQAANRNLSNAYSRYHSAYTNFTKRQTLSSYQKLQQQLKTFQDAKIILLRIS